MTQSDLRLEEIPPTSGTIRKRYARSRYDMNETIACSFNEGYKRSLPLWQRVGEPVGGFHARVSILMHILTSLSGRSSV